MLSLDWIGGFFDADGSVGLSKRCRIRGGKERYQFVPFLNIGQSDRGILEQVGKQLDAGVFLSSKAGSVSSWGVSVNRDAYILRADNAKAISIARQLLHVTHVKRDEIREVLAYYDQYNNYTKEQRGAEYERRYDQMVIAGDACRNSLNHMRMNKDTFNVPL